MMGSTKYGKLGISLTYDECKYASQPMLVTELSGTFVSDVSLGKRHSLASSNDGRVYAWGKYTEGFPGYEET